jgi:hypothetical protein
MGVVVSVAQGCHPALAQERCHESGAERWLAAQGRTNADLAPSQPQFQIAGQAVISGALSERGAKPDPDIQW